MTPEEKELLEKTHNLAEENNQILKGMRRSQRLGNAVKLVYWLLIVGLTVAGYYFAQMYIQSLTQAFGGTSEQNSSLIEQYRELLE